MESEINLLKHYIDDILRDINRKLSQIPNERELEYIHSQLKDKVTLEEFRDALEQKANKQSVTAALQSKADRFNIDELIGQRSDIDDMQRILAALESKVDYSLFEQLHADMQNKVDRSDLTHILLPEISKRAEKYEIELLMKDIKSAFEKNFLEHSATTDAYINSFKADLEQTRRSLSASLSKKMESKDIEKLYNIVSKKADFEVTVELLEKIKHECRDIANEIKRDIKKSEDFEFRYKLENELMRLKEELEIIVQQNKEDSDEKAMYFKALTSGLKSEFQRDLNKIFEDVKFNQDTIKDLVKNKVEISDFSGVKTLMQEYQKGVDKIRENMDKTFEEFFNSLKNLKEEVHIKQKALENDINENLATKVNANDIPKLMENKLDANQAIKQLGIKSSQEDISTIKKEIEKIRIELLRKSNSSDLESHVQSTELALEDVAKDMLLKCNIKDICALLDMKPNIDDINKALSEVHKELDNKLNSGEFSSHLSDYQSIIEALCAENCLGR